MIDWSVLFRPPDECIPGLRDGTLTRWGPMIRDVATGRWFRLLQETGGLQELLQSGPTPGAGGASSYVGILLSAGRLASTIAANVQLQQVKAMLSGLQMLTGASLAASVVGIGVSVAGFALVLRRLDQLERGLSDVKKEAIAARLASEKIGVRVATHDWAGTEALLRRGEEARDRFDAEAVWKQMEGPLYQEQLYWRGLIEGRAGPSLFRDPRFTIEEAAFTYEAALTLAATRVQTLLLLEEFPAACRHAQEFREWHDRVVSGLKSIDMATARSWQVAEQAGISEPDARTRLLQQSKPLVEEVHEISSHVAVRPAVIQRLMDRGIRGRAYVEALRDRKDMPFVTLPV